MTYHADEEAALPFLQPDLLLSDEEDAAYQNWQPKTSSKSAFLATIGRCGFFLIPSFFQHYFKADDLPLNEKVPVEKRRPTDYLDGLRGVASLVVFFYHYGVTAYPQVNLGYGEGENWNLVQLPFVRIFFSGSAMVSIFFVVSGYVLSHRCILLMHSQSNGELLSALTSTTFRRAMRLFIPSIVCSFIGYLTVLFGALPSPVLPSGFINDTIAYFTYLIQFTNVWTWEIDMSGYYAPHLWTIGIEFRCSMVLFLAILGLARCRTPMRLILEVLTILYCLINDRWDVALFIGGMLIAETNILYDQRQIPSGMFLGKHTEKESTSWSWASSSATSRITTCILIFNLIAGVFLTGYPRDVAENTPGYRFLSTLPAPSHDSKRRFLYAYGAMMIVSSISFLPSCQRLFSTPFARYLGKISYALYLVHLPILRTSGDAFPNFAWSILGKEGWWQFNGGWLLASLFYIPLIVWAADIFWRAVDVPAVDLARWIEGCCFVPKLKQSQLLKGVHGS